MRQIKDKSDRVWLIDLTIGCCRRVRRLLGVDLTAPEATVNRDGKPDPESQITLSQWLAGDVMLFVDVLFAMLQEKADELKITVDDFCEQLPPDLCQLARAAFKEEWSDFFRQLGRLDQVKVVNAAFELQDELQRQRASGQEKLGAAMVDRMRLEFQRETDKALAELTSGTLSTTAPESSGDSPTNSTI